MSEQSDKAVEMFERMARLIADNSSAQFGGAAVIVPPNKSGMEQPIEMFVLDPSGDPAQFIATLSTRLQIMAREIEDRARMQQGFGPR